MLVVMDLIRQYAPWGTLCILLAIFLLLVRLVTAHGGSGMLTVAFLDVGQGDAIYIEAPNGNQMLIDGGAGRAVLEELATVMPYGDRTIDVVLATHPDLDHIGGLPEVFARYQVGMFIESDVEDGGDDHAALREAVEAEGLEQVVARAGQVVALDEGVYLEILFPDRDMSTAEANAASVVARLVYGETSFLFTGDAPSSIETYLTGRYGSLLASDVLKLGHHGSKTSSAEAFLGFVAAPYVVVSAGCDNRYGHPHAEVIDRVTSVGAEVVSTCGDGTITFTTDGSLLRRN